MLRIFGSLCLVGLILLSHPAWSQDVGFNIGIRSDSADPATTGVQASAVNSAVFGAIVRSNLNEKLSLRYGMQYVTRSYQLETLGVGENHTFTYFEIPLGVMLRMSDFGGFFIGPALAFNLDKKCGSGTCQSVGASLTSLQVGGSFKFAPQLGAEVYYESGLGNVSSEVTRQRAVGVNLLVTFD